MCYSGLFIKKNDNTAFYEIKVLLFYEHTNSVMSEFIYIYLPFYFDLQWKT